MLQQDVDAARHMEDSLRQARMAAETAGRSRTAFLANMSHEIRTPMNAILGMTELALDTALDDEQRHYLSTVRSSLAKRYGHRERHPRFFQDRGRQAAG